MSEGIIYITRTQQDEPNYYKVGRTTLSSTDQRTRHDQTYISGGIKTIREFKVTDVVAAEKAAHDTLLDAKVSVPHAREIFNLDLDILVGKVKSAITPWLIGENFNDREKWILDFLKETNINITIHPFRDLSARNTIENITELLMRSISEPKGLSVNFRLEPDKDYEELIQNKEIGSHLQTALQNIDHQSLVKIDNWDNKIKIFIFLSSAPIFNPLPEESFRRKMFENRNKKIQQGLSGFNINKVIDYWGNNYFMSNPELLIKCFDIIKLTIYNSITDQQDYIFLRSAKLSFLKNAMKFCVNRKGSYDDEIRTETHNYITHLLGGHLILQDYPDIFSPDLIKKFMDNS